jgi:hypothetical protein
MFADRSCVICCRDAEASTALVCSCLGKENISAISLPRACAGEELC